MNFTLRAGITLGILVVIWTFIMGFTGWHKHPALLHLFWVVVLIQIGVLLWALTKTGATQGYSRQLLSGVAISAVASILVFAGSLLFTMVVFPNYFAEHRVLYEQMLREAGKPEPEIEAALRQSAEMENPFAQAVAGMIGTLMTGFIASALIALFHRSRGGAVAPA